MEGGMEGGQRRAPSMKATREKEAETARRRTEWERGREGRREGKLRRFSVTCRGRAMGVVAGGVGAWREAGRGLGVAREQSAGIGRAGGGGEAGRSAAEAG